MSARAQIFLGAALALAVAGMALTGCGSSSGTTSTEAADTTSVSPAAQEKAHNPPPPIPGLHSSTVAIIEPAPRRGGRVSRAKLKRKLAEVAIAREMKVPKPGDKDYKALRDEVLGELISSIWLEGEAEDKGIQVDEKEVREALRKSGEVQYLREAHYSRAAMLEHAKTQLLASEIEHVLKEPASGQPSESVAEFDEMFSPKWQARTSCARGFVVHQCSNYQASGGSG